MTLKFFIIISLLLCASSVIAQPLNLDSLRKESKLHRNDTLLLKQFLLLGTAYNEINIDSSFYFAEKSFQLAKKLELRFEEAVALESIGYAQMNMGNYPAALQAILSGIEIAENPAIEKYIDVDYNFDLSRLMGARLPATVHSLRLLELANLYVNLGLLYGNFNNRQVEVIYQNKARELAEQSGNVWQLRIIHIILARTYLSINKLDSAEFFAQKAYATTTQTGRQEYQGSLLMTMGRIQLAMGDSVRAKEYFKESIAASHEQNYFRGVVVANLMLSDLYSFQNDKDSGLFYANSALGLARQINAADLLLRSYRALNKSYKSQGFRDSSIKYQELIIKMNDSLFNTKQAQQFQSIDFNEQLRHREMEAAKKSFQNRLQTYGLLTGLLIFLLIAIFLWRSARQKQKSYAQIKEQKEQTDIQKERVERTLEELKAAQAQLIQSEKMASLGELTAGIAHEIQNPLNFVNNFSEVNNELIVELKSETPILKSEDHALILDNIYQNNEKIKYHGKRADAIVKNMLQHSGTSSGKKEPTDINALCDEYLRLAYHGMRAKDKSFNVKIETSFDNSIEKVSISPQEMGRVLVNLINNAFYALNEKAKLGSAPGGYEPRIAVRTRKVDSRLEIHVEDNGNGIPQKILDKIFQPFFTTRPAGQGTGLGLSLAYDIVKAHGGELKVKTKDGEGSEFTVALPLNNHI